MSTDLTAELAEFTGDVQRRAADLADRIRAATPAGHLTNEFVGYLNLAANMIAIARDETLTDGLHVPVEPADLDTADPTIDDLLRQFAPA